MGDPFKIDHHKINYHVDRLNDWLEEKTVYPIYVEIAPAGACNHRCSFCAVDYIGYKVVFLEAEVLKSRITEMGRLGIRSVMYAGEGEPLLHKDLPEIILHTKDSGIDVSITTNAVPLTEKWAEKALPGITWIKTSINAGSAETYAQIHQTKKEDFDKVVSNLEKAVAIRNRKNLDCVIGTQMVLLPENEHEAVDLAKRMKSIGCDYLVIKPYSQHKKSITRTYENIDYQKSLDFKDELESVNGENFSVVFRENTVKKLDENEHYYKKCYSTPNFWAYIMADGTVYGCSAYLLDERFCYGDINENSFEEIWEGERRLKNLEFVKNELNISECRKNCRMDAVNRYLWDLKNPPSHVNFI
ncbi:MAG: radical SAM protein [Candidatus Nitrohelix vancouverensis]|uniref:Radical SAM protein n=1 Tax=Candidatus Nitrohelix vancouverensis TaxID=2705534 RepID=A0A7T0C2E4_9BACT|nr:MAG: radical SAM protein [Candidatus Nitrohelix vancouverensis]